MTTNKTVVLIQLYGKMQPPNAEPLAVEALAGALAVELPDIQVKISTLSYLDDESKWDTLLNVLSACQPFLIGISIPQSTYEISLRLLDNLSRNHPSALIIIGHALPSYAPDVFLSIYPEIVVAKGWGEETILSITKIALNQETNFDGIPNLVFVRNGEIISNEIKWQTRFYKPIRISPNDYYARVEASRGCSYNVCTFCTRPVGAQYSTTPWFKRETDDVISEVLALKNSNVTRFTFTDEDFVGNDLDNALHLAHKLEEISELQFSLSVRADSIYNSQKSFAENQKSKKLFETLRNAGIELVFIGAESFSKSQLRRYGKGIDPEDNLTALSILQSLGINYEIGFILFDPLMSTSEINENIATLDKSGIWSKTGYLFSVMRPQAASPYVKLLISSELLGKFNINTLSYDYKFLDSKIELLAEFCSNWGAEINLIYLLCRNLERTTDSHIAYAKSMFEIRSLFFRLLKAAFNLIESEDSFINPPNTFREYYRERDGIINALIHHLQKTRLMNTTEKTLLYYCRNYISANKNSWF